MTETAPDQSLLSDVEAALKRKFDTKEASLRRIPSTAGDAATSERLDQLVLPDDQRARMPFTKDKYLVKENPHLVHWEREVRKFLRNLSPNHGHRISSVMIYEWATGINVAELVKGGETAGPDLRKINTILRFYFGKPRMTTIMGRKVPNCYRVPPGWYVRRHRPHTLTLYQEYCAKTLYP